MNFCQHDNYENLTINFKAAGIFCRVDLVAGVSHLLSVTNKVIPRRKEGGTNRGEKGKEQEALKKKMEEKKNEKNQKRKSCPHSKLFLMIFLYFQ